MVQYRQPGGINGQPTVQVGGLLLLHGRCVGLLVLVSSSSYHINSFGCFPSLVLVGPGVDCNAILGVMLLHCILVFTQSVASQWFCLQCKHNHNINLCMEHHKRHLSSSCLLWAASRTRELLRVHLNLHIVFTSSQCTWLTHLLNPFTEFWDVG